MAAKKSKKTSPILPESLIVHLRGFSQDENCGRGEGHDSQQPLFTYDSANVVIHDFMKHVVAAYSILNNVALAAVDNKNAKLVSGFPKVTSTNIMDVHAAVCVTHSKALADEMLEKANEYKTGGGTGGEDDEDEDFDDDQPSLKKDGGVVPDPIIFSYPE